MTVAPPARRPTTPRAARTRRLTPAAALAAATVLLAGCGGDEGSTTNAAATTAAGGPPRPTLADDVPSRSAAYAEATLRPDGDSAAALKQLKTLIGAGGEGALAKRLDLDHGLLPQGRTLKDDVLPHLGDHAAAFLLGDAPGKDGARTAAKSADGAIVAEVRDATALRKAVGTSGTEERVGDQTIRVTEDRAVWIGDEIAAVGTESAVRAAIAAAGGADLAGNERFTAALAQLRTTDAVGLSWVDLQQAPVLNAAVAELVSAHADRKEGSSAKARAAAKAHREALEGLPADVRKKLEQRLGSAAGSKSSGSLLGSVGKLRLPARDATAASALELSPGRLTVRSGGTGKSTTDPKAAADAVAALPAGSWAAFGGSTAGVLAKGSPGAQAFDRLSSALGTKLPAGLREDLAGVEVVSGAVQGRSLLDTGGALVLRAKDAAAAKALLDRVGASLGSVGGGQGLTAKPTKIEGTDSGLVVGLPGLPLQLAAGVQGDRLALGLGAPSVTKALASGGRLSSDPLYARAKGLLGGTAPVLIVQPARIAELLQGLGELSGTFGGGAGGTGAAGGLGGLLGSGGAGMGLDLDRVFDGLGRVKLVTAGRETTGSSTWRGSFVVEYDAAPKAKAKP